MEYGSEIVFCSKIKRKKTILLGLWKDFDVITVENNVISSYNSLNLKYHHLSAVGWGRQTYPALSWCPDLPAPHWVTWSFASLHWKKTVGFTQTFFLLKSLSNCNLFGRPWWWLKQVGGVVTTVLSVAGIPFPCFHAHFWVLHQKRVMATWKKKKKLAKRVFTLAGGVFFFNCMEKEEMRQLGR